MFSTMRRIYTHENATTSRNFSVDSSKPVMVFLIDLKRIFVSCMIAQ